MLGAVASNCWFRKRPSTATENFVVATPSTLRVAPRPLRIVDRQRLGERPAHVVAQRRIVKGDVAGADPVCQLVVERLGRAVVTKQRGEPRPLGGRVAVGERELRRRVASTLMVTRVRKR